MALFLFVLLLVGIFVFIPIVCLFVYLCTRIKANEERRYQDQKMILNEMRRLREQINNERNAFSPGKDPLNNSNATRSENVPSQRDISLPTIQPPVSCSPVMPSQSSFKNDAEQRSSGQTSENIGFANQVASSQFSSGLAPADSKSSCASFSSRITSDSATSDSVFRNQRPLNSESSLLDKGKETVTEFSANVNQNVRTANRETPDISFAGEEGVNEVIGSSEMSNPSLASLSNELPGSSEKQEIKSFEIDDLLDSGTEATFTPPFLTKDSDRSGTDFNINGSGKISEGRLNSPTVSGIHFELLIGRKFLGWVAAGLFILAAFYFIQMVSSMGWLTLTNRIIAAFITGGVFLAFGARYFIKELPRFGSMLTSTGIIIIFLTAYYARIRNVFPTEATTLVLILSVFGGFLLAAFYRSASVGVVAILGGLAVPCLLNQHRDLMVLAIYLLLLNGAVIVLINQVRRTAIASIAFIGSLIIFFAVFPMRDSHEVGAGTLFFSGFWFIYYLDLFVAFFRTNRGVQKEDLARMLAAPIIFMIGLSMVYCAEPNLILSSFGCSSGDFFKACDGWIVLSLCAVYVGTTYFLYYREREFGLVPNSFSPVPMGAVVTFVSFAVMIPVLLSKSFIAIAWLAAAVGLLHLYIRHDTKNDSVEAPHYRFWMTVFLILGLFRLYFIDLYPYLVSILGFLDTREVLLNDFLESSWTIPLFHRVAFPGTMSALILILGALFIKAKNVYDERTGKLRTDATLLLVVNGFVIFLILLGTDIASFVSVLIYKSGRLEPALWGWALEHLVYLLVAFAIYAVGFYRKRSAIRTAAQMIIICLLIKLCFLSLHAHPVLGGFSLKTFFGSSRNIIQLPSELMDFKVVCQDYHIPMTGPYALTYTIVSILLFLFGLVGFRLRKSFPKDGQFGSAWMGTSALLLWGVASLETIAYFVTRKAEYPQTVFYSLHALWLLWLMIEMVIFIGGCFFKNRLLRWIVYALVFLQLPIVVLYEFLWSPDIPVFALPLFNFDATPVIAYSIFLMAIGVAVGRFGKDHYPQAERNCACCFGIVGILLCWLMMTFDIFWYLCPRGIGTVTREIRWKANLAVTVLWSFYAGLLLLIGFRVRAALLRWLAIGLFALTTLKVILVDLTFVGQIYRIGAIFALAVVLMIAAGAYQRFRPNGT